jgi:hypothetical protein
LEVQLTLRQNKGDTMIPSGKIVMLSAMIGADEKIFLYGFPSGYAAH